MKALTGAGGDPLIITAAQTPYELALMADNTGVVAAIERVKDYRPENASFLRALGVATQKMKKGFSTSTTNGLVGGGFLTEAQGANLVQQIIED